jgi:DegV family protein with EDD domain
MKIGFMADSAADIPKDLQERYNIKVIPISSIIGDKTYKAGVDVTNEEYYDIMSASKEFPTTSQPTVEMFQAAYREMLEQYDAIICVTIASTASGTWSAASKAAEDFIENGADITIIDSLQLSFAIGVPVVNGAKMHEEGKSKEEIIDYIMTATRRDIPYFLLDDLTQLRKGGRLKASSVILANLLDIKPILWVNEGLTQVMDKVRGSKKSIAKLVDIMLEKGNNISEQDIYIVQARSGEKLDLLLKMIDEKVSPKSVTVLEVGPTIVTHCGLGVVGIYFEHK